MLPKIRRRPTIALNFRSLFQVVCCEKEKSSFASTTSMRTNAEILNAYHDVTLSLVRMRVPIPEENISLLRRNGRSTGNCRHFVKGIQLHIFLISERLHKHWLSHREPDVMASSP
jgi:hypothetical protein